MSAGIDRVWEALIDVERVAPCLPGAAITGRNDDGSYTGSFTVKIGPTSASYTGTLEMVQIEPDSHTATMHAVGTDRRGQGGASATIKSQLTEAEGGGTVVAVDTDYRITGRLARFGRGGMIEDISERLLREFAQRLRASLSEGPDGTDESGAAGSPPSEAPAGVPGAGSESSPPAQPERSSATDAEPAQPERSFATDAEPMQGLSLIRDALADRIRRDPRVALVLLGLLVLVALRRRR